MELQPLKVIYHDSYLHDYETASCENPERVRAIMAVLEQHFPIIRAPQAEDNDILMVHTQTILRSVKSDPYLYEAAAHAAGGSTLAGQLAFDGHPTFAAVRPPGHHASPASNWGFCFFNNIAIALEKLVRQKRITQALVLDIDLHFGDGTDNYFKHRRDFVVANIQDNDRNSFLINVDKALRRNHYDIIAVSAGFDRHRQDWGGTLTTEDYFTIGQSVREMAMVKCDGRFFAVLEGGYNTEVLGQNALALCQGLNGDYNSYS